MKKSFILFLLICFNLFGQDSKSNNNTNNGNFAQQQSIKDYNPVFHFPPVNQDTTSICWSFSTLSYIESEMKRLGKDAVKLSVNYPVYYGFIEKAKYYIQTKGKSRFKAGDLFGTVINVIEKYGIVPEKEYTGKLKQKKTYNQKKMYNELYAYMENVKNDSLWNENIIIPKVKEILNKHIGSPPQQFTFNNKNYTPLEFAKEVVNLKWDDYVKITSFKSTAFFQYTSLKVPDNWLSDSSYLNVPLEIFYNSIQNAIKNNYSMAIDGDMTEPGRIGEKDISIIPEYDIPSNAITQDAREYRFEKELTTDDHLMHIIGYKNLKNKDWFMVKDSWRDAFEGKHKGYFFFTDDYVKLKVLAYFIHRDAIPEIVNKIKE